MSAQIYTLTLWSIQWFSSKVQDLCIFNVVSIEWHRQGFLVVLFFKIKIKKKKEKKPDMLVSLTYQKHMADEENQPTETVLFMSTGSFSFESRKLATSICLLFLMGMKRSPPILEGVCFLFLPTIQKCPRWLADASLQSFGTRLQRAHLTWRFARRFWWAQRHVGWFAGRQTAQGVWARWAGLSLPSRHGSVCDGHIQLQDAVDVVLKAKLSHYCTGFRTTCNVTLGIVLTVWTRFGCARSASNANARL